MGRVLEYPKPGYSPKFDLAKQMLNEGAAQLVDEGIIFGSLLYGSVATGTANIRSDCDLLVVTLNDTAAMVRLKELFLEVFTETDLSVNDANVWNIEEAVHGRHTMDSAFLAHFPPSLGDNLVGYNPLEVISPSTANFSQLLRNYIAAKKRRFMQAQLSSEKESPNVTMQKALELPVNLGRKTMTVFGVEGLIPKVYHPNKPSVIQSFGYFLREFTVDGTEIGLFLRGLELDVEYSRLLDRAVNGEIGPDEYNRRLNHLYEQSIPTARELALSVDRIGSRYLPRYDVEGMPQMEYARARGSLL